MRRRRKSGRFEDRKCRGMCAGSAGSSNDHSRNEITISTKGPREEKTFSDSFRQGAAELPAHPALPAKKEPFVFEEDPKERAAIQGEPQKDGG
ncbi:MAG: hypothetical protein LBH75_06210 [Treponema sp.]|nr:hypothetical protein [Treponema sp.]